MLYRTKYLWTILEVCTQPLQLWEVWKRDAVDTLCLSHPWEERFVCNFNTFILNVHANATWYIAKLVLWAPPTVIGEFLVNSRSIYFYQLISLQYKA